MADAGESAAARGVYVISVAAELAGVHPQTLRIYERKGLVQPARTGGGNRRYSEADIDLLRRIQDLTSEGLNLEGVRRVLELEQEVARLRHRVSELRAKYSRDLVPVRQTFVVERESRGGRRS